MNAESPELEKFCYNSRPRTLISAKFSKCKLKTSEQEILFELLYIIFIQELNVAAEINLQNLITYERQEFDSVSYTSERQQLCCHSNACQAWAVHRKVCLLKIISEENLWEVFCFACLDLHRNLRNMAETACQISGLFMIKFPRDIHNSMELSTTREATRC
jgi:hypothetical protein